MAEEVFDLAVIGGGINGCGIARDAAGRGLRVLLAEQGDLAGATSSASTKLIHGGLRYLEYYEFRLVREALAEREVLLRAAPHVIQPMRFVLPHHSGLRPRWWLRLGLFLYDHLGGRHLLQATRTLDLQRDPAGLPLKPEYRYAFEYSDCWVDDARLVILNAIDARERGATILTRTRCTSAARADGLWRVRLRDTAGHEREISARALVNAAGPFLAEVQKEVVALPLPIPVRLVKGSHIVVPKLFNHDRAYFFQNRDGRIFFAIPFQTDFTLIGTTDLDFVGDPSRPTCGIDEIAYLCNAASGYFRTPVEPRQVVWTFAGVRPLVGDGKGDARAQDATRDYVLHVDTDDGGAPLLTIVGGKITTYRRLAEAALHRLEPHLPAMSAAWTAGAALPGGDFPVGGVEALARSLSDACPFLDRRHALRLALAYGTRAMRLLSGARRASDLGQVFAGDFTEAEADYLIREEWALSTDDILWRRSKLGLRMSPQEAETFSHWLEARLRASTEGAS